MIRVEPELKLTGPLLSHPRLANCLSGCIAALLATVFVTGGAVRLRAADVSKDYSIKAAFLVKFAHYVRWPPVAFADPNTPVSIGVLGEDPFGGLLDQLALGEMVGSEKRKIVIKRSNSVEDLKTCHILFIGKSQAARIPQILTALGQASILTVGETDGFAHRGGIVNFYLGGEKNDKVRFEINNDVAVVRGLQIDPGLLRLAKIVQS